MSHGIRITASNSSKHTPKSIAKHQLYKSTGTLATRQKDAKDSKRKPAGKKDQNAKVNYTITGYNDLNLYPELNLSLAQAFDMEEEDEVIEDTTGDDAAAAQLESPVIRCVKYLLNRTFEAKLPPVAKGVITKKFKDDILHRRGTYPPVLIKNQLYSVFVNQITKVDKEVDRLVKNGELMTLLINHIQFSDNLIVLKAQYLDILRERCQEIPDLVHFERLIVENNAVSLVTREDLQDYGINDVSSLVQAGFLNFSQHDQSEYYISLPNLGNYLNLLKQSNSFVIYLIQRAKGKAALEKDITEKWKLNYHNWYKFYGLDLRFVLSIGYGMGFLENFNTNVGPGWRLS